MTQLPELVASVPLGDAYVRLIRRGVTYTGGPYASRDLARQSAGRLFNDVPNVSAVSIVNQPTVTAPLGDLRWYARAVFRTDGYTALVGPFASRTHARSDLMELADRGQIGAWHDWVVDYHYAPEAEASRERARWARGLLAGGPTTVADPSGRDGDRVWRANGEAVARWIASEGYPDAVREDLLRDIVLLWEEWPGDESVWETLALVLGTCDHARRALASACGVAHAFRDVAAAIDDCAAGRYGAEAQAHRALRALVAELRPGS